MGQTASRATRQDVSKGILVTLDALGTIYRFRKPVGEQYIDIARSCGLNLRAEDVTNAFKKSYKTLNSEYPNYGKGKLDSPEAWWHRLAADTFDQFGEVPPNLGARLYEHFTTNKAYELFSDVRPFIDQLRNVRRQFGPIIIGIITNSDPRVRNILQSLDVTVGDAQHSTLIRNTIIESGRFIPPWQNAYDINRDFDFLTTSYEAGSEKPSPGIFLNAQKQASVVLLGRASSDLEYTGLKSMIDTVKLVSKSVDQVTQMRCIHIGDEVVKDHDGATNFGFEALLLDRDNQHEGIQNRIGSLEEAAAIISLMAQDGLSERSIS